MTPATTVPPTIDNPLWHALQRVPPDEALLRALETTLLDRLTLSDPCRDLRDRFGRNAASIPLSAETYHSIIQSTTTQTANQPGNALQSIYDALVTDGCLVLFCAGSAETASTFATTFSQIGFHIERWQPYYSAASRQAAAKLAHNRAHLWQTLTGHYVPLPCHRFVGPLDRFLRPYYDAELALYAQTDPAAPDPAYDKLLFLLRKHEPTADQALPPAHFLPTSKPVDQDSSDTDSQPAEDDD